MHNLHYKKTYGGVFFVSLVALVIMLGGMTTKTAHADTGSTDVTKAQYTLLTPLPCNSGLGIACNGTDKNGQQALTSIDLADFISYAYKLMLALAVVLAVIMITIGGFEYMLSGAMDTKSDAKKKITDATLGLLLALCSYLILYTIDPNLVSTSNLCIPPIGQTDCTGSQAQNPSQYVNNQLNNPATYNPNPGGSNGIPNSATSPSIVTPPAQIPPNSPYQRNLTP